MATRWKTFYGVFMCLLLLTSTAIGFLLNEVYEERYNLPKSSLEQSIVSAETEPQKPRRFLWKEQYELCCAYGLNCEAVIQVGDTATEEMLRELSLQEIAGRYPIPEWNVVEQDDNVMTIYHNIAGLCPVHRKVYHLGVSEDGYYLTVYFGPSAVGNAAGAFLVTDVLMERLSLEQQQELTSGQYEYYSQDDLISMLDNFSEL